MAPPRKPPQITGPVPAPPAPPGPAPLPGRLLDCVALVAEGLTDEQIARRLGLAVSTVKSNLAEVRERLGLEGRGALGAWHVRQQFPEWLTWLADHDPERLRTALRAGVERRQREMARDSLVVVQHE